MEDLVVRGVIGLVGGFTIATVGGILGWPMFLIVVLLSLFAIVVGTV